MSTLFVGSIAGGVTKYVDVPIVDGRIGVHIAWLDATSNAAITLELSSNAAASASDKAGSAWVWSPSGIVITGPTAAAAGSSMLNVENVRQKYARLKIVAAANCAFEIYDALVKAP